MDPATDAPGEAVGWQRYPTCISNDGKHMAFWDEKTLEEMTPTEWEALCDGCGRCCLMKLEDEDTGEIYRSDVRCRLLDGETCRCSDYPNRQAKVKDCIKLTPENVAHHRLDPQELRLPPHRRGQGPRLVAPADLGRSRDGGRRRHLGARPDGGRDARSSPATGKTTSPTGRNGSRRSETAATLGAPSI